MDSEKGHKSLEHRESIASGVIFGGISGIRLPSDVFELGGGVFLRRTYAHLFSPNMMAFARAEPGMHHPAPWRAVKGGFSYDIEVELASPTNTFHSGFDAREVIWWIAALLRIVKVPFISVPVITDHPFCDSGELDQSTLEPFEIGRRLFQPTGDPCPELDESTLIWVKEKWVTGGKLLKSNPKLTTALKAFDSISIAGRVSSSLLALWGAIEQLFAPSAGELRFRVASLLASYLTPPGKERFDRYKEILKLYNERSVAAHTASEIDIAPLLASYVLLRNALVKMIDENKVPSQEELEALLFGTTPTAL